MYVTLTYIDMINGKLLVLVLFSRRHNAVWGTFPTETIVKLRNGIRLLGPFTNMV